MKYLPTFTRRSVYLVLLLLASLALILTAVLLPLLADSLTPALQVGQVASRDFRALHEITFTSEIWTERQRDDAEQAVPLVYTSPDTRVARRQLEQLRAALTFINSVRADNYATPEQKLNDLAALEDVTLGTDKAQILLDLNDTGWQEMQQESLVVLERVMSSPIRTQNIGDARGRVPALVSLSFPEDQANVVAWLVQAFVAPNSQPSEELTQAARLHAREMVAPVVRSFVPGQTVVLQGEILDLDDVEALNQMGLVRPQVSWQELVSAMGISLLMTALSVFYLRRKQALAEGDVRKVALIAALFSLFLLGIRLVIPSHTVLPYVAPIAAYSLTVAALLGTEIALVTSLPLVILAAYGLPNSLELMVFYLTGSAFGVLALGRARRVVGFVWAGVAIGLSSAAVVLCFRLPLPATDFSGLLTLFGAAIFGGLVSASAALLFFTFLAGFLGMVTAMQLIDLSRPDHPLLRLLLRDAPGTYQHSLQVSNLAEQAAERIGADAQLTRVGALYHDIGKIANPIFFIENQPPGYVNPHEGLDPASSSAIIVQHVRDGLQLGRKYRLPQRILDFIAEHHGTSLTRYQYVNAVRAAGGDESLVDPAKFSYPGPRPQSRETAILMLADGSEARVRAERPTDDEKLRDLIQRVVSDRIASGQLEDTRLTLQDLVRIIDSFTETLRGVYHPRIHYPRLEQHPVGEPLALPPPSKIDAITEPTSKRR
jgi:cyclic-di-AMP phosphodiesterase PgpH